MDNLPERLRIEETSELLKRMHNGDESARARLISGNLRLVSNVAWKHVVRDGDYDELFSEGVLAMMQAIDDYEPSESYPYLSGYVGLKVNARIGFIAKKLSRKRASEHSFGFYISVTPTNAFKIVEDRCSARQSCDIMMKRLTEKEKLCVERYFGMNEFGEKMSIEEIAKVQGVTKERVRQIIRKALCKMRDEAERKRIFVPEKTAAIGGDESHIDVSDEAEHFEEDDDNEALDRILDEWISDCVSRGRFRVIQ